MQTQQPMREKTFNMRFSEIEFGKLQAIADHHGITAAEFLRRAISGEFNALVYYANQRAADLQAEPASQIANLQAVNWNQTTPATAQKALEKLVSFLPEDARAPLIGSRAKPANAKKGTKK